VLGIILSTALFFIDFAELNKKINEEINLTIWVRMRKYE
jgi:hypothetical protein